MRLALSMAFLFCATSSQATELPFTPVPKPVAVQAGKPAATVVSPSFTPRLKATGSTPLENPNALFKYYGYAADGPLKPKAGDKQTKTHNVEATKTEPDKHTYLVLQGQKGPDKNYNYGTHFLFQAHESGPLRNGRKVGHLTRINLDADPAHRVTLMASRQSDGQFMHVIDGSTWNPFANRLLLTGEAGKHGGVWQATAQYPSKVESLTGILGIGSYEGIQTAADGSIWIVEDSGGVKGTLNLHAKQPNSFVYRFLPKDKTNLLLGGRLQALQVLDQAGSPITFHAGKPDQDIKAKGLRQMFTYGVSLQTRWITIHNTAVAGTAPFSANALAKSKNATPLKRPENGVFRPATNFTEFYFTQTGDTDTRSEAGASYGGYGGLFKLSQTSTGASTGKLTMVYRGNAAHTGFDNLTFASADALLVAENTGERVHKQRGAYDSIYAFDVTRSYAAGAQPRRLLALGRDASATIDSGLAAVPGNGFQNGGDNEVTGLHVSDGDATAAGLLGAKVPDLTTAAWRMFYTRQHGDNATFELVR